MRRNHKVIVIAVAALIVAFGLSFGLVKAYAQSESALEPLTPVELMARMLDRSTLPAAVSGDIVVANELLGSFPADVGRMVGGGPGALVQSGSGRLWAQGDKVRIDAQGVYNDTVLYYDGEKVAIYDSTTNTLTEYSLPDLSPLKKARQDIPSADDIIDPRAVISQMVERLAPAADLLVSGPEEVAGRDCYILTLTPAAPDTLFGSLEVAVDGETYLPLQIAVYAKGYAEPVLLAGFTSVSYDAIDNDIFALPSPERVKTEQKQLELPFELPHPQADDAKGDAEGPDIAHPRPEPLTPQEASLEAGFEVLTAESTDPSYAFQGAYVLDLPRAASDTDNSADSEAGGTETGRGAFSGIAGEIVGADGPGFAGLLDGPMVLQVYGRGFGTVVMIQAQSPSMQPETLQALGEQVPFLGTADVNGAAALQFATPLVSFLSWQQGTVTIAAIGSVSVSDLVAFAASVR